MWRIVLLRLGLTLACVSAAVAPGANRCERDKGTCFCEGQDNARCLQLTPVYELAPRTCTKYQDGRAECTDGGRAPFCEWVGHGDGHQCRMSTCWLRFMNTLASCPGLLPNLTVITPDLHVSASAP
eukprot:COSAG05_NODE_7345_length_824_cov_1.273103_1_plen_125_part_10